MQKSKCIICDKEFYFYKSDTTGKYCSRKCYGKVAIKNLGNCFKGRKHKPESINKMKLAQLGDKHHSWKSELQYTALHKWVERNKGRPKYCIDCKTTSEFESYDWSNVDHKYRKNLDDFSRRCKKCHRKYDKKLNDTRISNKQN